MSKKVKNTAAKAAKNPNSKLNKKKEKSEEDVDLEALDTDIDPAEADDAAEELDEDIVKAIKAPKPKPVAKPVVDKHDYIAELERDEVDFDDL